MMAHTSPEWKKPADVMKLRRRKSLCANSPTTRTETPPSNRSSLEMCPPGRKAQKRKNPFACLSSSGKVKDSDEDTEAGDFSGVAEVEMNCAEAVPPSHCFIDLLVSCSIVL